MRAEFRIFKENKMKKLLTLALAMVSIFAVSTKAQSPEGPIQPPQTVEPAIPACESIYTVNVVSVGVRHDSVIAAGVAAATIAFLKTQICVVVSDAPIVQSDPDALVLRYVNAPDLAKDSKDELVACVVTVHRQGDDQLIYLTFGMGKFSPDDDMDAVAYQFVMNAAKAYSAYLQSLPDAVPQLAPEAPKSNDAPTPKSSATTTV